MNTVRWIQAGIAGAALAGAGVAIWAVAHERSPKVPGEAPQTSDDHAVPASWKREVASFVYRAKAPDGSERGFSVEAQVLGGTGFHRIGTSFDDAVRAAHEVAQVPLVDKIHNQPINQAQGVFQAANGVFWIAPLGGFHRGTLDALFIDGAFWDAHGLDVDVLPHTTALKAVVGAHDMIDLRNANRS